MNRREFLTAAIAASSVCSCSRTPRPQFLTNKRPPNIVLILADDMGVGDVQALWPGSKIPTPHLDRLAAEGMSFTDAHSGAAVCTPTRYGLLTGRYSWRTILQEWIVDLYEPPLIAEDRLTLPGMLRDNGYRTACIGKWHLGCDYTGEGIARNKELDITAPVGSGPTTRGFDYYFGTDVPNFPPFTFIENDRYVVPPTDAYQTIEGIRVHFAGAPMAPGWRFDEILPTLTERSVEYIHQQAKADAPFFLYFSMTSPHEPISPSAAFQGKSGIAPVADFVMETDWSAGRILQALEDAGIADNTLVIFTTDNGHAAYTGSDILAAAGHHASGPYRGYKGEIYEGGHRVPLLVRWPGVVAPGTQSDQLVCLTDLMATCAEVVGEGLPPDAAEDSFSLVPAFQGNASGPIREHLVNHDVRGNFALREGNWKLVLLGATEDQPVQYELYDLDHDAAEASNLAAKHPERVQRMIATLEQIITNGRSTPGPRQPNDTLDITIHRRPPNRYAAPRPGSNILPVPNTDQPK